MSVVAIRCSNSHKTFDRASVKSEIEAVLKIQEDAYGDHSPEAKKRTRETCMDSLVLSVAMMGNGCVGRLLCE
jgi:hypothetical protein